MGRPPLAGLLWWAAAPARHESGELVKNGRRIGAQFERKIANELRNWLGEDWTVSRNEPSYQCGLDGRAGEFHCVGPMEMPLVWELKAEKRFKLAHLFRSPLVGPIEAYWQQASAQAASVAELACATDEL